MLNPLAVNLVSLSLVRSAQTSPALPVCPEPSKTLSGQETLLLKTLHFDEQNAATWLSLGQVQWQQGQCDAALNSWRKALELGGDQKTAAAFQLGRALYADGQREAGLSLLKQTGSAQYFYNTAQLERFNQRQAVAQPLYELAFALAPSSEFAEALASLYQELKKPEQAVRVWQQLAEISDKGQPAYWWAQGEAAKLRQDWSGARQSFEQALKLSGASSTFEGYLRLIRVLVQQKDWPAVLEISRKAIELKPHFSTEPYRSAARAELEQGHYAAGIGWYDRAIAEIPQVDPWPDIEAGEAAEKQGDLAEAERRYLVALKRNPDQFVALLDLGQLNYRQGHLSQAIAILEKIALTGNCNVLANLAKWQREAGNLDKASQYEQTLVKNCGK
jgi:tetratricopeptide (TPR) repeat protein